jgi:hypothetical protein
MPHSRNERKTNIQNLSRLQPHNGSHSPKSASRIVLQVESLYMEKHIP